MTREPAEPLRLDYLIKAGTIHSMTGQTYRAVGLRGAEIAATSTEPDALDDLAGHNTVVVDAGDLTLLPAFADSHEHLMEASRNTLLASIRCSCESAKAGNSVRSPASTTTVLWPARSSSASGSVEVAAISAPRRPTAR